MIRSRVSRWVAVSVLLPLALAACGSDDNTATTVATTLDPATAPKVRPVTPALTITDVLGKIVTVAKPPERVVCLVNLCDDMLIELGMRPVATTGRLLADPNFLGAGASSVPMVKGGFLNPDIEDIIGLKPDLVIGLNITHDPLIEPLKAIAPVWIVNPNSIEDSIRYLRDLATLVSKPAEEVVAEQRFRDKLAAATAKADKSVKAVVVEGVDDKFFVIAGGYTGDLLGRIYDYPWPQRNGEQESVYSLEEVIATGADVMFVLTYNSKAEDPKFSEVLVKDPLWKQLNAVKNGKVHEVDTGLWGSGRGTRSLGIVIDEALAFHP